MKKTKEKIIVISTGGTIEKTYDENDGSLVNRETVLESIILPKLRLPSVRCSVRDLMHKDSLDMTENDRKLICKTIQVALSENCPVIVVHGTDTMAQTAKLCTQTIQDPTQPVIFTGAMKPLEFISTDAVQNLTEAIAYSRVVDPGIYISFHSNLFDAKHVEKNYQTLTFEQT